MLVRQHQDYEPVLGLGNRNPNLNLPSASGFRRFVPVLAGGKVSMNFYQFEALLFYFYFKGLKDQKVVSRLVQYWLPEVGNNLRVEQLGTLVETTNCKNKLASTREHRQKKLVFITTKFGNLLTSNHHQMLEARHQSVPSKHGAAGTTFTY